MPGILRSVPSGCSSDSSGSSERKDGGGGTLVAPSALRRLLHGRQIAQQGADACVGIVPARHDLSCKPGR